MTVLGTFIKAWSTIPLQSKKQGCLGLQAVFPKESQIRARLLCRCALPSAVKPSSCYGPQVTCPRILICDKMYDSSTAVNSRSSSLPSIWGLSHRTFTAADMTNLGYSYTSSLTLTCYLSHSNWRQKQKSHSRWLARLCQVIDVRTINFQREELLQQEKCKIRKSQTSSDARPQITLKRIPRPEYIFPDPKNASHLSLQPDAG